MTVRRGFGILRLVMAAVGVVALVGRFEYGLGFNGFTATNYFGYLTIQSNIAAVVVAISSGTIALRASVDPPWLSTARISVTSLLVVAGVVFAMLASQASSRDYRLDVPWSDQLLHFVIPAVAVLDWVLGPGRNRPGWHVVGIVLAYPVGWGVITLIRGALVGWYPYFFLDPRQVDWLGSGLYCGAALALFAGVATALLVLARLPTMWHELPRISPRRRARARR